MVAACWGTSRVGTHLPTQPNERLLGAGFEFFVVGADAAEGGGAGAE